MKLPAPAYRQAKHGASRQFNITLYCAPLSRLFRNWGDGECWINAEKWIKLLTAFRIYDIRTLVLATAPETSLLHTKNFFCAAKEGRIRIVFMLKIQCPKCGKGEKSEVLEVLPQRKYRLRCSDCTLTYTLTGSLGKKEDTKSEKDSK